MKFYLIPCCIETFYDSSEYLPEKIEMRPLLPNFAVSALFSIFLFEIACAFYTWILHILLMSILFKIFCDSVIHVKFPNITKLVKRLP